MYRVTVTDSSTSVTASVEVKVVGSYCDDSEKVKLCHIPPGNPDSKELHEICVSKNAVSAHLAHGYWGGECYIEWRTGSRCPVQQETEIDTPICPEK